MSETTDAAFARALIATGPSPERGQRLHLFGQLVGSWRAETRLLDETTGVWHESTADWIFAYTLGGLAVQDVLVPADDPAAAARGTTVRVYDPALGG
jgi:hypothetical protein